MRKARVRAGIVILGLLLASVMAVAAPQSITAYWFEWAPATMLEELSKDFTKETGIEFKMSVTAVENWVQKINVEMAAHSDAYDIIIADSQDVGGMVTSGHFVDLTDWVKKNKVDKNFTAASMTAYAEYPEGLGQVLGRPDRGRRRRLGLPQGPFRGPEEQGRLQGEVQVRPGNPPRPAGAAGHRGVLP